MTAVRETAPGTPLTLPLLDGERWWGGASAEGRSMPYPAGYSFDLRDLLGNQGMPLLLSNRGRWVHSTDTFSFTVGTEELTVTPHSATAVLEYASEFGDLRGAYRDVLARHYPASGTMPEPLLFTAPQYNLWIETVFEPTQEKVLAYAERVLAEGFAPGVIMIDDQWSNDYGNWTFHPGRFPDPAAMVARLHELGFKVMLWLVPYVTPDSPTARTLNDADLLVADPEARYRAAVGHWWNGWSSALDLLNPEAVTWLQDQLTRLQSDFGIDGFKFDGGDAEWWRRMGIADPEAYVLAWNRIGLAWPLNEYREAWRTAGLPLAQRQQDKYHQWEDRFGIESLIPNALAQAVTGHAFTCPDMIGGGEFRFVPSDDGDGFDAELFVRYAQIAALFPMMQFSAAPWRLLSPEHLEIVRQAAALHTAFGAEILAIAEESAKSGEPIQRPLEWAYPDQGYADVTDQFLIGDTLMVAPVTIQGATTRTVEIPPGTWTADDTRTYEGPTTVTVDAPLARLPYFRLTAPASN
ncbi:glycoside hydrolase family 31 protein [Yinghuangia soli]|uniref:Glycoside hydrolase family 31 protein n=1 Tax=Yinghuangia soli TaxID=2908204 RepID=A0AA41U018_9ACTN|nr:glycoside hydrolase family 31 protein [Yinghuangia soli]MCF2528091.1 glycoside hydrolase family 31 protein [Yinghuangia soli]